MSHLNLNIREAGYGKKVVLNDISLSIEKGRITVFIGPNGAGKSTLLKTIIGTIDFVEGEINFDGKNILEIPVEQRVEMGIGFVPQGNRVFSDLKVIENLKIAGYILKDKTELKNSIETVLKFFPDLENLLKRDAGDLSGGEKQQLALARALVTKPKILMLDEPSLGLSPQLVQQAFDIVKNVKETFGCTIIIVEQKVRDILKVAEKVFALKLGKVVFEGTPQELEAGENLKGIFLD